MPETFHIPIVRNEDGSLDVSPLHIPPPGVIVPPPDPDPPLTPPEGFTASWNGTAVVLRWNTSLLTNRYAIHRVQNDHADHHHEPQDSEPIAIVSGTSWTDTLTQTDTEQEWSYCPAMVRGIEFGPCSEDITVTIPARVVVPPPPPPPPPIENELLIIRQYGKATGTVIKVNPFPGAKDYWVYDESDPHFKKAAGGNTMLEWNGIPRGKLIVEALDKLAPFQYANLFGVRAPTGHGGIANGHGPATNVPVVMARSRPFDAEIIPLVWDGEQAWLDTFANDSRTVASTGDRIFNLRQKSSDNQWDVLFGEADFGCSNFVLNHHDHMMDYLADGASSLNGSGEGQSPQNGPLHNNNAWVAMRNRRVVDISGGKVAHFRTEVDAFFNARRWCDIWIIPAEDEVVDPGNFDQMDKLKLPNTSGKGLIWALRHDKHELFATRNNGGNKQIQWLLNTNYGDHDGPGATDLDTANRFNLNGSSKDIDLRHTFDIFVSNDRVVGYESYADGSRVKVFDKTIPGGLGFSKFALVLVHKVYHTANDINEVRQNGITGRWVEEPYGETRHWGPTGGRIATNYG